jgi:hypothetical protein
VEDLTGYGFDDIIFNNKGIDTISQIANYKTVLSILDKNNMTIDDNIKHTPIAPYINKIQEQLIYDNKTRYKINNFKPVIKYSKISKGAGLSNYIIIIQNIPTLFDYATSQKKAKDFYCMVIYTGLHQPTKNISNESIKFISKMLKRKSFKINSVEISSDFIDNKPINYKRKDEVKQALKRDTDPKSYIIMKNSLYCNSTKHQTIKKVLIYDKYIKQLHQKQLIKDNLNGWKRLEIEIKPTKRQDFNSYIKSDEFKKDSLGIYDTISNRLNISNIDNSYLNYQINSILDNRTMNNKNSLKQYNSKDSLTRFKMSEFKPYMI